MCGGEVDGVKGSQNSASPRTLTSGLGHMGDTELSSWDS